MANYSTNDVSFEDRLTGISVGVQILVLHQLRDFIEAKSISETDFRTVLFWFDEWNLDVPFILAKYDYFESGMDYDDAVGYIESIQEGYETIELKKMVFIISALAMELEAQIERSQKALEGTFQSSISMNGGVVSAK
jgi:hypothetical protein